MIEALQGNLQSSSALLTKGNRPLAQAVTESSRLSSFGTRSRLEIGEFSQVFSSSGSVRRDFPDVFRFTLSSRNRLRIYVGNQFSNPRSGNRRMVVDLLNDRNLRRVNSVTVNPTQIDAITTTLSPGTYRIRIATQSSDRGRYFLDMVRL